ncbi:MAG: diguanylate cyclase (GGDEF)-like protein [Verrucomicrobiales bacterium]
MKVITGPFPHALQPELESFLNDHPETTVAVIEEPVFQRVPLERTHPLLQRFREAPALPTFGRQTHVSTIQASRAARLDGTSHVLVNLGGREMHLSSVSMVGTPYLILLLHPSAGLGPCGENDAESNATVFRGQCDSQLHLLALDDDMAAAVGISQLDVDRFTLGCLVHPDSVAELLDCWVDSSALGAASCTVRLPDGDDFASSRWFQATLISEGEQTSFVFSDTTNNPQAQRSQDHRIRLQDITETVPHGIFRVSSTGLLLYKNSKLDDIFGRELKTQEDFRDIRTLDGEPVSHAIPKLLSEAASDEGVVEITHDAGDLGVRTIRLRVRAYQDINGDPEFVGSAEDITEEVERSSQLEVEALTDPMTGTANRRALELALSDLLEAPDRKQFGVLLCDLDGFKQVNDSLGHGAGDDVIAEVGRRLQQVCRDGDMVARLGGDEFVVVAHDVRDYEHAMEFAHRILPLLRKPFSIADMQIELSGSVGVAVSSPDSSMLGILQMADHAMYEAKRAGRNQAMPYQSPDASNSLSPLALRRDLRRAIAENGLDLAFQPIFSIHDLENPEAAEALLRWEHPVQGRIHPSTMISIAEQSGLIRELGEWIVTEAIRSAAAVNLERIENDRPISIAVNVSAQQVGRPDFVEMVAASLDFHQLEPSRLTIELTESFLIDRVDNARDAINALAEMGVRLAVDDFGTGSSTFEYLLTLPVYAVKIDPSFTRRLTEPRGAAMLRGLSSACRELDMQVIAEGVETFEQLNAARRAGVTHAQGYLLGMPVSTSNLGMLTNSEATQVA